MLVISRIFGQCDKQQGHRGEALLAVDEQTPADTIRADAAFLHPYIVLQLLRGEVVADRFRGIDAVEHFGLAP